MQENSVKKKWNLTGKGPSWSSGAEIQENIDRVGRLLLLLVGIHSSQGRMWGCLNNHQISRLEIFLIFNLEMALQRSSLRRSWLLSSTLSLSEDFLLKAHVTKRPVCPNVGGEMSGLFLLLVSAFLSTTDTIFTPAKVFSSSLVLTVISYLQWSIQIPVLRAFPSRDPLDSKWTKIGTLSNLTLIDFSLTQIISTSVTILNIQITAKDYT